MNEKTFDQWYTEAEWREYLKREGIDTPGNLPLFMAQHCQEAFEKGRSQQRSICKIEAEHLLAENAEFKRQSRIREDEINQANDSYLKQKSRAEQAETQVLVQKDLIHASGQLREQVSKERDAYKGRFKRAVKFAAERLGIDEKEFTKELFGMDGK